jgi:hypothetical protein
MSEWRIDNAEKLKRDHHEWYLKHRGQVLAEQKNLKTENPEEYRAMQERHNALRQQRLHRLKEEQPDKYRRYLDRKNETGYVRELRRHGQFTVPKWIKLSDGRKIPGVAAARQQSLGTANMTTTGTFLRNPQKAVKQDYRSFGVMPIYRRAKMAPRVNLSTLPVEEVARQREVNDVNEPAEVLPGREQKDVDIQRRSLHT